MIERLQKIGLSPYEAKAYVALVQHMEVTPTQLSKLSSVPGARTYDILAKLEMKGFCILHPGKTKKYLATDPCDAIDNYINLYERKVMDEVRKMKSISVRLKEDLKESMDESRSFGIPLEYIWMIRDPHQISHKFSVALKNAEEEILSLNKAPYAPQQKQHKAFLDALDRGVTVRDIYQIDPKTLHPEMLQLIEERVERGNKVRFLDKIHHKLSLYDNTEVWMAVTDPANPQNEFTVIVLRHPNIVELYRDYFEYVWNHSIPFEEKFEEFKARAAAMSET